LRHRCQKRPIYIEKDSQIVFCLRKRRAKETYSNSPVEIVTDFMYTKKKSDLFYRSLLQNRPFPNSPVDIVTNSIYMYMETRPLKSRPLKSLSHEKTRQRALLQISCENNQVSFTDLFCNLHISFAIYRSLLQLTGIVSKRDLLEFSSRHFRCLFFFLKDC